MANAGEPAQKTTRHWIVVLGTVLVMIAASVPLSGVSFFHPYIFASMPDVAQSTILVYFTLLMVSIVVSMMFLGGPLISRYNPKILMIVGSAIVSGSLLIFYVARSPSILYLGGVVLGLGYGISYQLIPIVWVNNWFVARKGLVIGIVTGGTGIGGMAWSFLVPAMGGIPGEGVGGDPDSFRRAYLIIAVIVFALTVFATLSLIVNKPSDIGLVPYGAAEARAAAAAAALSTAPIPGFTFAQAMRNVWVWTIFAMSLLLGIVHAGAQIMAPYLVPRVTEAPPDGLGQPLSFFSLLMMTWTLGLIILKPTLGILNDKLGVMWAMIITLSLQAVFFALFLPNYASLGLFLPFLGMVFMAAGMSNGTVQPPLLIAGAVGPRAFAKVWSVIGTAWTLGMAVGAPIWGTFYDPATGSYTLGFYLAPVAIAVIIVGSVTAMNAAKRQHMTLYEAELAEREATQRPAVATA